MTARRTEHGATLVDVVVAVLLAVVCAGMLIATVGCPPLSRARQAARTVTCANNLRQLGLAVFMYADVYNGTMPTAYENLWNRLGPYLEEPRPLQTTSNNEVWRCPSDAFLAGQDPWGRANQCSYAPNADETGAGTLKPEEEAGLVVEVAGEEHGIQYSPFTAACKGLTEQVPVRINTVATDTILVTECWRTNTQNSLFLDQPTLKMRETSGVPQVGSRNSLLLKQYTSAKGATVSNGTVTAPGPFNFLIDYAGANGTALSRTYHQGRINVLYVDGHVAAEDVDAIAAAPGQGQYSGMKTLAEIPFWNKNED